MQGRILTNAELYSTDDDSLIVRDEAFYEQVCALRMDHRDLLDSLRACHAALEACITFIQQQRRVGIMERQVLLTNAIELTKAAGVQWPEQGEEAE